MVVGNSGETEMKILFLDIDGVINSARTAKAFNGYPWNAKSLENFDKVAIRLIQLLCEETNCSIVLSSTWRLDENWMDLESQLGLPIIDRTPKVRFSSVRGEEIKAWLEKQDQTIQYAIVDDTDEMLDEQKDHFVHVDGLNGLSYENYNRLKELLT